MAFWQNKNHEIDFVEPRQRFIEVKHGKCNALEFSWFAKQFSKSHLKIINKNKFETNHLAGLTLEDFLLGG